MIRMLIALVLFSPVALADPAAVVFDCDGVVVDTEPLKYQAWVESLRPRGVKLTRDEYLPLVGLDGKLILGRISKTKRVRLGPEVLVAKERIYAGLQKKGVPKRAATIELIRYLAAHKAELKIKLGLASGGHKAEILENLRQTNLTDAFDVILSGHDDLGEFKDPAGTNKPKPYIYQKMAKALGVSPADLAVFEDSAAGVEAAAGAGATVYAIPTDFTRGQDFKRAKEVLELPEKPEPTLAHLFTHLPGGHP